MGADSWVRGCAAIAWPREASKAGGLDRARVRRYDRVMKELPPGLLDEIVRRLVETLQPLEIYLFGSHAHGTPHAHSDLDFLVVVPDDAGSTDELAGRAYSAMAGLSVPKDIVVYHRSEMDKWSPVKYSLAYEAVQKGKRLYVA
jgi:predicted nucleotidyltransferase